MARIIQTPTGLDALTFDDVLLQPGHSEVMPGQTNIATRIARDIDLNLPILSSAMDTVTEGRLAIAMAQAASASSTATLPPSNSPKKSGR